MSCNSWKLSLLFPVLAILAIAGQRAEAQIKPFKIQGGGTADYIPTQPGQTPSHVSTGQATELGNYTGKGSLKLIGATPQGLPLFASAEPFVFTAANGDQLAFTYGDVSKGAASPGIVYPEIVGGTPAQPIAVATFVAEFNPYLPLCTGRFAKVTRGSFIMTAVTAPFKLGDTTDRVAYSWQGEGWIEFRKGK